MLYINLTLTKNTVFNNYTDFGINNQTEYILNQNQLTVTISRKLYS